MGHYNGKPVADSALNFSIFDLKRLGFLTGLTGGSVSWNNGQSQIKVYANTITSNPAIRLAYTLTDYRDGSKREFSYKIKLETTDCHFGGVRYWFICSCGCRVGKLFLAQGYFVCRFCLDPIYESQLQNYESRGGLYAQWDIAEKVDKLERSIGTRFYAGKPTRKQIRIYKLYARLSKYNRMGL